LRYNLLNRTLTTEQAEQLPTEGESLNLEPRLSKHARQRALQYNLSPDDIAFVYQHGRTLRNAGVLFIQMLRRCMPKDLRANDPRRRLDDVTLLITPDGELVVTIYRNEKAFLQDRKKSRHRRPHRSSGYLHQTALTIGRIY
jgi:hypothetical protein